jgi:DNA-binding response OmpR family regulator
VSRILIVEPHPDTRSLLELVFRRCGHEAVVYTGLPGEEAGIDLAVIEPGDGLALPVARRLRDAGVPLLFISIFAPDDSALELGPLAYLVKPFPLSALEAAVDLAVAGAAA